MEQTSVIEFIRQFWADRPTISKAKAKRPAEGDESIDLAEATLPVRKSNIAEQDQQQES